MKRPREASARGTFDADAARVLDAYQRRFEKGDAEALLEAVDWILMYQAKPPDWVRWHFTRKLGTFRRLEVLTLDEAFGIRRKKDPRVIRKPRAHMHLVGPVTLRLWEMHNGGIALTNDDAFRVAAEEFSIDVREVRRCWREGRALLGLKLLRKSPKARS